MIFESKQLNLTEVQKAYIAGIFDTEGSIYITKSYHNRFTPSYTVICTVTNTDVRLLNHLKYITGLGVISQQSITNLGYKLKYDWRLRVKEIKILLPLIKPYLIAKELQSELVLEFIDLYEQKKFSYSLIDKDKFFREIIYSELCELNKKGPEKTQEPIKHFYTKTFNKLTEEIRSYLAAIIDGDGYIGIGKMLSSYAISCNIYNTNVKLINYLREIIGFGIIKSHKIQNDNWSRRYTIYFTLNEIKYLLPLLMPYFILKWDQAYYVLEMAKIRRASRRFPLSDQEKLDKQVFYELIKELNKKGM